MFDVWKQSKIMNGFEQIKSVRLPEQNIDSLDDLKRLAGVNEPTSYGEELSQRASNLGQIQRERDIKPGTDEWFRLWFARPKLTGEKPY